MVHDQTILSNETRLTADLGVAPWLAVGVVLPLRTYHTSIRYLGAGGQPVSIENASVHHRNETLVGPGDPWLVGRAATSVSKLRLGGRLGVAVPLGRTEPDPFVLGDMGQRHEHSQFGAGTLQPLVGIDLAMAVGPAQLQVFALSIQSLYDNAHGYRAGDRYAAGLSGASGLGLSRWQFRASFEAQKETAESWNGVTHADEGNTGRFDVLAGIEATWQVNDDWHVAASYKLPLYTHVEGGQLDSAGFLGIRVGTHVDLWGADRSHHGHHHHDHGDDDEHSHADDDAPPTDWSGLDMKEITSDGSAVPLEPVPGKITVFDFWATWCAPCGVVDRELAALVRRHPNEFAIRKVRILEVDSPAALKYLNNFMLPHLKVFGRDGVLLWERSAPPSVLTADVEKLVGTGD